MLKWFLRAIWAFSIVIGIGMFVSGVQDADQSMWIAGAALVAFGVILIKSNMHEA